MCAQCEGEYRDPRGPGIMEQVMNTMATVEIQRYGDYSLARVRGEIDTSNIREVADALGRAGPGAGSGLVVDLSAVTYLNSATVKVLFDLAEGLRARQQQLRLVMDETAPMRGLMLLLRFDLVMPVHTRLEDAIMEMRAGRTAGGADANVHAD